MKRKELLAKSLTLGLAVATAATSMSVPGGLLAPEAVYASTEGDETAELKVSFGETPNCEVGKELTVAGVEEGEGYSLSYAWYRVSGDTSDTPAETPQEGLISSGESGSYTLAKEDVGSKILAVVTKTPEEGDATTAYVLSDVVKYAALPNEAVVKYNGADAKEVYNENVAITATMGGISYIISNDADHMGDKTSYEIVKPDADDSKKETLFFQASGDGDTKTIYQKNITVKFDVTAPTLSDIPEATSVTTNGAIISVTSNEAGKAYYLVKETEESTEKANIKNNNKSVELTENSAANISLSELDADKTYYVYVVAEDNAGNLSEVKSVSFKTATETVDQKPFSGKVPSFDGECFDETKRTLTATVAEGTTAAQLEYVLDGSADWIKGDAKGSVLTVSGSSVTLNLGTQEYKANTIKIRVAETEDTSASEEAVYAQAIPRAGVDLSKATVKINGDEKADFTYTGTAVITAGAIKVTVGEEGTEFTDYNVIYTAKAAEEPGTETEAPTEVGDYKLWIVPASEGSYGSQSVEFSIKAIEVTEENIGDYFGLKDLGQLSDLKLTYDANGKCDDIFKYIDIKKQALFRDYEVLFKKTAQDEKYLDDIEDAGTYNVYLIVDKEKIKTAEPVSFGAVTIDKYQPKDEDITVTSETVTYNGSEQKVGISLINNLLDKNNVVITYKQGETQVDNPTNAGTYDVWVSYTESDNCKVLEPFDTKATLTIEKATVNPTFDATVVKPTSGDAITVDLSSKVTEWTLAGTDTSVGATVTVDAEYSQYIEGLEYNADNKKVSFKLSEAGKALQEQTEFPIHVEFTDCFTNYKVSKFDLPVIITTKDIATITIEDDSNLTYTGTKQSLSFKKNGEAISESDDFKVTITKDSTDVTETGIVNAGTYVVTAVYNGEAGYGKLVKEVTVNPKTVTDVKELLEIGKLDLKYDMKTNFADQVRKAVKVKSGKAITLDDCIITTTGDVDTKYGYSLVGDITVTVDIVEGNYHTDSSVELGKVRVNKGTIDLTVSADNQGRVTIKVGNITIANNDSRIIRIAYFKGDTPLGNIAPTEAGDYRVVVDYEDITNLEKQANGVATFTIPTSGGSTTNPSPSYSGSTSTGGSSSTPSKDDAKKDETKTETKTETKADGTTVTTTDTKAADGSVQTKIDLKNDTTGVAATVNVAKDAQGKVTDVTADVTQTATDKKTAISAATVAQITEAAGTKNVEITTKTVDAKGKTVREVTVNASDLTAGNKLKVVAVDPKTGKKVIINKTTYKVAKDGSLALDNLAKGSYEVVTPAEANALSKEILKSIKPEKTKANVVAGKKAALKLDDALNMDNVAKITYKTSKKSVATVNADGKITTKKAGKVTIKAVVTLNNGKKKTVKMTVTVKAPKKTKK